MPVVAGDDLDPFASLPTPIPPSTAPAAAPAAAAAAAAVAAAHAAGSSTSADADGQSSSSLSSSAEVRPRAGQGHLDNATAGSPRGRASETQQHDEADSALPHSPYHLFLGSLNALPKALLGWPLDTSKTLLQTTEPSRYPPPFRTLRVLQTTVGEHGLRGLYKGVGGPAAGWACVDAGVLGGLWKARGWLYERGWREAHEGGEERLTIGGHVLAGGMAGLMVCVPWYRPTPLELSAAFADSFYRSPQCAARPSDRSRQEYVCPATPHPCSLFLTLFPLVACRPASVRSPLASRGSFTGLFHRPGLALPALKHLVGRPLAPARLPQPTLLPAPPAAVVVRRRRRRRRTGTRRWLLHAVFGRVWRSLAFAAYAWGAPALRLGRATLPLFCRPSANRSTPSSSNSSDGRPNRPARTLRHPLGRLRPGRPPPRRLPRPALDRPLPERDGRHVWDVRGPAPRPRAGVGRRRPGRARQGRPDVFGRRGELARLLDRLPPRCVRDLG